MLKKDLLILGVLFLLISLAGYIVGDDSIYIRLLYYPVMFIMLLSGLYLIYISVKTKEKLN